MPSYGIALFVLTLVAILFDFGGVAKDSWDGPKVLFLILAGLTVLAFLRHSTRKQSI